MGVVEVTRFAAMTPCSGGDYDIDIKPSELGSDLRKRSCGPLPSDIRC